MSLSRRGLLAGGLALGVASGARAAVSLLQLQDTQVLVLVDEEQLDKPLLARLERGGFRHELEPVPDCPAVDFGLLTSRIQQAGRVIGLLGPANHVLVMEALRFVGARVELDAPAETLAAPQAPPELLALRHALAGQSAGLSALAAWVGR